MSEQRMSEIRELLFTIDRKLRPLEWDASRNQINEFKKVELERLHQEKITLVKELQGLETQIEHP